MISPLYTVQFPFRRGAERVLTLEAMTPGAVRSYALDCSKWTTQGGVVIVSVVPMVEPPLSVGNVSQVGGKTVLFTLGASAPAAEAELGLAIFLSDGGREDITLIQPVLDIGPFVPPGSVLIGGQPSLIAQRPVDINDLEAFTEGALLTDGVFLVRPGVNGGPATGAVMPLGMIAGGVGEYYEHTQSTASASWIVQHNLGRFPVITVIDSAGSEVEADVHHDNPNRAVINFSAAMGGTAACS